MGNTRAFSLPREEAPIAATAEVRRSGCQRFDSVARPCRRHSYAGASCLCYNLASYLTLWLFADSRGRRDLRVCQHPDQETWSRRGAILLLSLESPHGLFPLWLRLSDALAGSGCRSHLLGDGCSCHRCPPQGRRPFEAACGGREVDSAGPHGRQRIEPRFFT